MSKKLVVSLFAGAMLLSAGSAFAAAVNGPCVNCHTMHNSQNGADVTVDATQHEKLLLLDGCAGCHTGRANQLATGMAGTLPIAPQVDDNLLPLSGGYFSATGALGAVAATLQHNVANLGNDADVNMASVPGSVTAAFSPGLANGPVAALTCEGCHTNNQHHNTVAGTYRMLPGANNSTEPGRYGVLGGGVGNERQDTEYDATAMNAFCARCHGDFHTNAVGFQDYNAANNTWKRHPTDIAVVNGVNQASIVAIDSTSDIREVVVGHEAATWANNNILMCLSCHVPHGGPYPDLLAFQYDAAVNAAGDNVASTGCETCHSYGGNGM